jgi:hypothetical protein
MFPNSGFGELPLSNPPAFYRCLQDRPTLNSRLRLIRPEVSLLLCPIEQAYSYDRT